MSLVAILRGRPAEWAKYTAEVERADAASGIPNTPLEDSLEAVFTDVSVAGHPSRGVARLDAVLAHTPFRSIPPSERQYFYTAATYAFAGRPDRARAILAEYSDETRDSAMLRFDEPSMHKVLGEIALAEHRPQDALREFARGDTAADGQPDRCGTCFPLFAGRAYDEAGSRDSAIMMYERYEHVPSRNTDDSFADEWFRPLVYKRLGELYEEKGDAAQAAANYRQFIAFWQNAEPDLQPVVADARRRLAKLSPDR